MITTTVEHLGDYKKALNDMAQSSREIVEEFREFKTSVNTIGTILVVSLIAATATFAFISRKK